MGCSDDGPPPTTGDEGEEGEEGTTSEEGDDDGGPDEYAPCKACPDDYVNVVVCAYDLFTDWICGDNQTTSEAIAEAVDECALQKSIQENIWPALDGDDLVYDVDWSTSRTWCPSPDPTTGNEPTGICTGWDPDADITLSGGVYYYEWGLLTDLVLDHSPLYVCDDARFVKLPGSGVVPTWEIEDADDGELLYELGLRDGDILLEVNGYPLETYTDVLRRSPNSTSSSRRRRSNSTSCVAAPAWRCCMMSTSRSDRLLAYHAT